MALDTIGRAFGEQGRVPDHVKSTQYVLGDSSDLTSGIADLHPLLGKQKQHIQGRVTWSETKLIENGIQKYLIYISIQPPESILCRSAIDSDYTPDLLLFFSIFFHTLLFYTKLIAIFSLAVTGEEVCEP